VVIMRATLDRGVPCPFVPWMSSFWCPRHQAAELSEGVALLDTGSSHSILPSSALPVGHVTWDDLEPGSGLVPTFRGNLEYRWWEVRVQVLDVDIARRWKVFYGGLSDFPVFGTDGFFRAFSFAMDWGADPPVFAIEPYARHGRVTAANLQPIELERFPAIVSYADQATRRSIPGELAAMVPSTALPAGAAHPLLAAPEDQGVRNRTHGFDPPAKNLAIRPRRRKR
jgi:hypothetical protein